MFVSVILLFIFYMPYSFLPLIFCFPVFFFFLSWFFVVKLNSFLIFFCVYYRAVFFMINMGITFTILKLYHSNLNMCQLNLNKGAPPVAQRYKSLPAMQETLETWVQSLGQEDPLEKEMATHPSSLAWKIPWTEEPGGLLSMESERVRHDWAAKHNLNNM